MNEIEMIWLSVGSNAGLLCWLWYVIELQEIRIYLNYIMQTNGTLILPVYSFNKVFIFLVSLSPTVRPKKLWNLRLNRGVGHSKIFCERGTRGRSGWGEQHHWQIKFLFKSNPYRFLKHCFLNVRRICIFVLLFSTALRIMGPIRAVGAV